MWSIQTLLHFLRRKTAGAHASCSLYAFNGIHGQSFTTTTTTTTTGGDGASQYWWASLWWNDQGTNIFPVPFVSNHLIWISPLSHTCYMPVHLTLLLFITSNMWVVKIKKLLTVQTVISWSRLLFPTHLWGATKSMYNSFSPTMLPFSHWARGKGQPPAPPCYENKRTLTFGRGYNRVAQIFQKSKRHIKILGARTVTYIKFHTKGPQIGVKLQSLDSSVTWCQVTEPCN